MVEINSQKTNFPQTISPGKTNSEINLKNKIKIQKKIFLEKHFLKIKKSPKEIFSRKSFGLRKH